MLSGEYASTHQPKTIFQKLKRVGAEMLGRETANRISAPFHDWQARRRTRQFLVNLSQKDLMVNLGCGYRPLSGWLNVDVARGPHVNVVWDLREGLPFADNSCSAVFSEHVIEHLSKEASERLLKECYRVLQPNGVLRISTPDAGRYLRSYAGDCKFLQHPSFSDPIETPLDRINQMMREYGQHLWVYDSESLLLTAKRAGFSGIIEQNFGVSIHPNMQGIDSQSREFESLYVEAVK